MIDQDQKEIEKIIKNAVNRRLRDKEDLEKIKRVYAKNAGVSDLISSSLIVCEYEKLVKRGVIKRNRQFERLIKKKQVRTSSGVAPVAILTKPYYCPGKCIFCPSEKNMPKSYLSNEPAAMRALSNKFDPVLQVKSRLKQYKNTGHNTEKIEVIILGGTFNAYTRAYQEEYIKGVFAACNNRPSNSLKEAQRKNEKAMHKIVCLSIETRPDMINEDEIKFLRYLGVTKIQLGVQTVYDDVLKSAERGHNTQDSVKATKLLKDAGFKICYHMMVNLPKSTPKKDLEAFKTIFKNTRYLPDGLKIYPCVVLEGTKLFDLWKVGDYKPYKDDTLYNLIYKIKKKVPEFVRIDRIYRDIPKESIIAGSTVSNIRQVLKNRMGLKNDRCRCIRCREIKSKEFGADLYFKVEKYKASEGFEYFLSYIDKDNRLYAILRLRVPSQIIRGEEHFIKELQDAAIVREIHTFGISLEVGERPLKESQHRGLGVALLIKAERIIKRLGIRKMAIISGVGVRNYFKKFGYKLIGSYMVKEL